jgi:EmrB/QacA subfamily drug resistance transporter
MSRSQITRPAGAGSSRALTVVCLATAMLMLDIAVVNTAMSRIARDLDADFNGLEWVVDAYTLALATVVLSCGSLADRLGRRRVFAAGMALFTAASLACGASSTIVWLDVARAVQGVGAAGMFATSLAILSVTYREPAERGRAFAALGAAIGASFAVGPLIGGALTSTLGWRSVFLVNVPLGLLGLLATRAWVPESSDPAAGPLDRPGQVTLGGGLFLLVLGLLRGGSDGWSSHVIIAELVGAAVLLALFLAIQARTRAPMLPLGLFSSRAFAGSQVTVFAISASFFAIYLYATLYLQQVLHLSPIGTGLVYLPCTVVVFLVSAASVQLGARIAPGILISGGLGLVALGLALLTIVGVHSSWAVTLPGMVIGGIGTGLFNPAGSALALSSVPERHSGLASGINDTFRQAGIPLGVAVYGALVPAGAAVGHGSPEAFVDGFHQALWVACGIAAVGALAGARLLLWHRSPGEAPAGVARPRPEAA